MVRALTLTIAPLRMAASRIEGTGGVELMLYANTNATYVIEASTNLQQWTAIITNAADGTGLLRYVDQDSATIGRRFYRALPAR